MKYILTYQPVSINYQKVSKIHELNEKYRDNLNFKPDEEIEIYKSFLPDPNQEHFVFVENSQVLHLESDVANLHEFQMEINSQKIIFSKAQANFRMVQNFAWATQLIKQQSEIELMALVYVYELSETEYIELCKQSKSYNKYDATTELKMLRQKNADYLRTAYLNKNICLCPALPKTVKLIGIFNPTTGVENKSIVFVEKTTADISEGKKKFINSVKYAVAGYRPAPNKFGLTSYDEFQMPIVNLSNNIMYLCNSDRADVLEDAMLATSSAGDSTNKNIGYCTTILQSLGINDSFRPSAPEYQQLLDTLRTKKQEISRVPIVSGIERQNLIREFASIRKMVIKMQNQLNQQAKQNTQKEQEINKFKRRQNLLMEAYYNKRLVICEKNYIGDHPELRAFYRELTNKLTEFFIACKVISSEKVARQNDKIQDGIGLGKQAAKGICELGGQILGFIPGIGFAVDIIGKCVEGGFEVGNAIYNKREVNLLKKISRLTTTLSELDEIIEETARRLTLCYEKQIRCLTCASKQKGIKRLLAKGALRDDRKKGGVEHLAEAAAAKIISAIQAGVIDFKEDEDLVKQMFGTVVFGAKTDAKFTLFKKARLATKEPQQFKKWNTKGIFLKSGVKLVKRRKEVRAVKYYHSQNKKSLCGRPEKYGYRFVRVDEEYILKKLGIFKPNKPIGNHVDDFVADIDIYCQPTKKQLIPM